MKISIITPSLNRATLLENALRSVADQAYPDFEHIIVDGGSTDGTAGMVRAYEHVRFISEPDNGMYDALNKGLMTASGDIVGFLNTDDLYAPDAFHVVVRQFTDDYIQAVAGRAVIFAVRPDGGRTIINEYAPANSDLLEGSTLGSNYFNAWFFRRSVFCTLGMFDSSYRIIADRDFMLRFTRVGLPYATTDELIYQYRWHSDSLTLSDSLDARRDASNEVLQMIDQYFKDASLPKRMRYLLVLKRRYITAEMAIRYLKLRDMGQVLRYAVAGMRRDAAWLPEFTSRLFSRSPGRV